MKTSLITRLLTVAILSYSQLSANEPAAGDKPVVHQRISVGEYQNFIGNWDDLKVPVLCALIRSPGDYKAVFHPAAVMRNKKPYAPDRELFEKEQIVVVAKVMTAPSDMDKAFVRIDVAENGDALIVSYQMSDAKSDATNTVKNFLALRIPKKDYTRVVFMENGKQVGELKPAEGAWCNFKLEAR